MRAAALVLAALVLGGCGGSEPAAVPEGFQRFEGSSYTFAHPAGWSPIQAEDTRGFQGPKGTGGLAPQAAASSGQGPGVSLELIIDGFKADQLTRRGNFKILSEKPYELEGAEEAQLTESRYDAVTGDETTPVREIDLHALTEDGVLYALVVRAAEADFDRARLREVIDTFRLE